MLTSLAPSPIPKVVHRFFLISQTISCFCFGVTLQQMMALHELIKERRDFSSEGDNKSSPVTTKQQSLSYGKVFLCSIVWPTFSCQLTIPISSAMIPQEIPILIAVYFLSPVSIQILIPAYLSFVMVSFTLSWSLSSIAVPPISYISLYKISSNYVEVAVEFLSRSRKCL